MAFCFKLLFFGSYWHFFCLLGAGIRLPVSMLIIEVYMSGSKYFYNAPKNKRTLHGVGRNSLPQPHTQSHVPVLAIRC